MVAPSKEEHLNSRIKRNHIKNGFENGIKQLESEEYHPVCEKTVEQEEGVFPGFILNGFDRQIQRIQSSNRNPTKQAKKL